MARSKNLAEILYTVVQDSRFDQGDTTAAKLLEVVPIENESQKAAVEAAGGLLLAIKADAQQIANKILGLSVDGVLQKITLRRARVRVLVPQTEGAHA